MWAFDEELLECIEIIEQIRLKVDLNIRVQETFIIKQNKIQLAGKKGFQFTCWLSTILWISWEEYDSFIAQQISSKKYTPQREERLSYSKA